MNKASIILIFCALLVCIIPSVSALTLVNLTGANGGISIDDYYGETGSGDGTDTAIWTDCMDGSGEMAGLKLALDQFLPSNASIVSVQIHVRNAMGSPNKKFTMHEWENQTWTNGTMGALCGGGPFCANANNQIGEKLWTGVSHVTGAYTILNDSNISNNMNESFAIDGLGNYSFILNHSCVDSSSIGWASTEYSAIAGYNPFVYILYEEMPEPAGGGGDDINNITYFAWNDAYVDSALPNTNYGNSTQIWAGNLQTREAYIRFNLDPFPTNIMNASLCVYNRNWAGSGNTIYVHNVSNDWYVYNVTDNTKPAKDTQLGTVTAHNTIFQWAWDCVNISTDSLANENQSFVISYTFTNDGRIISSRENDTSYMPFLKIRYNASDVGIPVNNSEEDGSNATAPAGGSGGVFYYNFSYNNITFKYERWTGALTNLTYAGQPVAVLNQTLKIWDDEGNLFNITNATVTNGFSSDQMVITEISHEVWNSSNDRVGTCLLSLEIRNDSNRISGTWMCTATENDFDIYRIEVWGYPANANSVTAVTTGGAVQTYTLTAGGSTRFNRTIDMYNGNKDFIRYINASSGLFIGTSDVRFLHNDFAMPDSNRVSPTWIVQDLTDSNEHQNEFYHDGADYSPERVAYIQDDSQTYYVIGTEWGSYGFAENGYTHPRVYRVLTPRNTDAITTQVSEMVRDDSVLLPFFLQLDAEGNSGSTEINNIEAEGTCDGSICYGDEPQFHGLRFMYNYDMFLDGAWTGVVNDIMHWGAQAKLARDIDIFPEELNEVSWWVHASFCLELLRDAEYHEGNWNRYGYIDYSTYGRSNPYFGNNEEGYRSCYLILSSDMTSQNMKEAIMRKFVNVSIDHFALNDGTIIGRERTITMKALDNFLQTNSSTWAVNPLFQYTGAIGGTNDPWSIYYVSGLAGNLQLREVNCYEGGTVYWYDDFTSDTSGNYTSTVGGCTTSYDAINDALDIDCAGGGYGERVTPSTWNGSGNYTCEFTIYSNTTHTTTNGGYMNIYMRWDGSTATRYSMFRFSEEQESRQSPGGVVYLPWATRDVTKGTLINDWQSQANTTAYSIMFQPSAVHENAGDPDIIFNIAGYKVGHLAEMKLMSRQLGLTANDTWITAQLNGIIDGYNWMIWDNGGDLDYDIYRNDGYLCYSQNNCNHDGGYLNNYGAQKAKYLRAGEGNREDNLPFFCYYMGVGRETESEGGNSYTYKSLSHLGQIDTRCSQYMVDYASVSGWFDDSVDSDDLIFYWFYAELDDGINYYYSNCSDIYDGKIATYYKDNHIKLNYSTMEWGAEETCTNTRIGTVSDGIVVDAWQDNGTTNTYIYWKPIPPVTYSWASHTALDYEAHPRGTRTSNSYFSLNRSTYWNDVPSDFETYTSFYVEGDQFLTINIEPPNNGSQNYTIAINSINTSLIVVDANGYGSAGVALLDGDFVEIILGGTPSPPPGAPVAYNYVVTNITSGWAVNWSDMEGWIGGGFLSGNESTLVITLTMNGSIITAPVATNNTWYGLSLVNLSGPGYYATTITNIYNTTGTFFVNITNLTSNGTPVPTPTPTPTPSNTTSTSVTNAIDNFSMRFIGFLIIVLCLAIISYFLYEHDVRMYRIIAGGAIILIGVSSVLIYDLIITMILMLICVLVGTIKVIEEFTEILR